MKIAVLANCHALQIGPILSHALTGVAQVEYARLGMTLVTDPEKVVRMRDWCDVLITNADRDNPAVQTP